MRHAPSCDWRPCSCGYESSASARRTLELRALELVRDMRRAQSTYFRTRHGNDLRAARDLERRVDELLAGLVQPRLDL